LKAVNVNVDRRSKRRNATFAKIAGHRRSTGNLALPENQMEPSNQADVQITEIHSPWLTPEKAADYLSLSTSTLAVWRTIPNHALKFKLCSTRIRYHVADLDAYVMGGDKRRVVSPNVGRPPGSKNKRPTASQKLKQAA
jgi:hypothetical protein